MKMKLFITCFMLSLGYVGIASAQQLTAQLVEDQNPRYMESQNKYAKSADSLIKTHGTTIQDTYKAYDWYEARMERRRQNREWRHQERMNGSYYYDYDYYTPSYRYNGYYNNGYYNNYRSGRSWWYPSVGFRTGNFWFNW